MPLEARVKLSCVCCDTPGPVAQQIEPSRNCRSFDNQLETDLLESCSVATGRTPLMFFVAEHQKKKRKNNSRCQVHLRFSSGTSKKPIKNHQNPNSFHIFQQGSSFETVPCARDVKIRRFFRAPQRGASDRRVERHWWDTKNCPMTTAMTVT